MWRTNKNIQFDCIENNASKLEHIRHTYKFSGGDFLAYSHMGLMAKLDLRIDHGSNPSKGRVAESSLQPTGLWKLTSPQVQRSGKYWINLLGFGA